MKSRFLVPLACSALVIFGAVKIYAAVTETSTNVPLVIPDATTDGGGGTVPGVVSSTLNFSVNGTISDVNLNVAITHTWNDDIEIRLTSPAVAAQLLWNNCGGSGDNFSLTIDQQAGALSTCPTSTITGTSLPTDGTAAVPVAAPGTLNAFNGTASGGVWTLAVSDNSPICTGTLTGWGLTIDGPSPLPVELMTFEVQ